MSVVVKVREKLRLLKAELNLLNTQIGLMSLLDTFLNA